ncbi:hypothetical protein KC19_4G096100 [Ceratodon purpureus]|uniref:Protein kinase domain-containing protein n=1 Tax=Ceratodon purpureus TaxID=3225 RepID=A0A8T0I8U4_CERPU|nr:hypothetical protein KC19_4G096100 [Ceratodon purpureus]
MAFSAMKKIFKPKAADLSDIPEGEPYGTPSATPSATSSATTLKQFLELTEACNEQAQEMLQPRVHWSHRVNYKQCKYLAQKLKLAVERAHLFLLLRIGEALSAEELVDVFKLLLALANAVEEFIRSCCQNPWIQAAFLMTNVSEHVLAISFDLELLADFFSGKVLIRTTVDSFYRTEALIVKNKASQDREALLTDLNTLLQRGVGASAEHQLADFLLKRLETQRQNLAGSLPEAYRTDMGRLKQKEQLGRGSFATVFKAMWLGVEVAKKAFYQSSPEFAKEVSILGALSHPNITSLFCYAQGKRECCMVMELMDGDLSQMMRKIMADDKKLSQPFRILEAFDIMLQIGGGMEYLHGKRLVHRDLKAMNILVKHVKGRELEPKTVLYTFVKVADFGLSKIKERSMTYGNQTLMVGTTRWMAPELIKSNTDQDQVQVSDDAIIAKYPFASDVYSFGMVCYEILTGEWPQFEVKNLSEVKKKVLMGDRPKLPLYCPPGLKDLIERCWSEDASKRPRFSEICAELRLLKYAQILDPYRIPRPRIVVGLDFGSTFSGFAFAHMSKPEEITTSYDWPMSGMRKPYCKTLTAIYYEAGDATTAKVKSWGFPALHDYTKDINNIQKLRANSVVDLPEIGTYLVRFNLHLASKDAGESSAAKLPNGFTVTQVIADYLREIGARIMRHLRTKFGDHLTMADVQWCVTVPSIWDDHAKKQMQVCVARGGLIRSVDSPAGSPHPLSIVLEPEAASRACHRNMPDPELKVGDRLLVANIGDETTDIFVQEWISETPNEYRVEEFAYSTGGRCGAMYVDVQFNKFLFAKIQCLPQFLQESAMWEEIFKRWEEIKCSFGDLVTIGESFEIQLPSKLAAEWEEFDEEHGNPPRTSYDELELTHADIKAIFDPVVEQNLALIADQISRTSNIKVIFVVGGFAGSPYLLTKIRERFLGTVEKVISHVVPASAASQGAVLLVLDQIS